MTLRLDTCIYKVSSWSRSYVQTKDNADFLQIRVRDFTRLPVFMKVTKNFRTKIFLGPLLSSVFILVHLVSCPRRRSKEAKTLRRCNPKPTSFEGFCLILSAFPSTGGARFTKFAANTENTVEYKVLCYFMFLDLIFL